MRSVTFAVRTAPGDAPRTFSGLAVELPCWRAPSDNATTTTNNNKNNTDAADPDESILIGLPDGSSLRVGHIKMAGSAFKPAARVLRLETPRETQRRAGGRHRQQQPREPRAPSLHRAAHFSPSGGVRIRKTPYGEGKVPGPAPPSSALWTPGGQGHGHGQDRGRGRRQDGVLSREEEEEEAAAERDVTEIMEVLARDLGQDRKAGRRKRR
jgi:hypothetical protein